MENRDDARENAPGPGLGFRLPGYEIRGRIGRGGFAVVYEAVQLSLERLVAIKVLLADLESPGDRARFERERRLLTELGGHRHIVDVIDAGIAADGRPFIVMRLHRRGSLAQQLEESGPLPVEDVVTTMGKIGSALQAAHDHQAVHRDVKPENILVADDGEPVLADFGIAAIIGPAGGSTTSRFTLAHVAPEVLEYPDSRLVASDVYSLASTAYTLLTGRPVFAASSDLHLIRMLMDASPPPLGRPDVPAGVEAVIRRGLAKDPADRYPSATAFAQALRDAWTERSTLPGPPVPATPFPVAAMPLPPPAMLPYGAPRPVPPYSVAPGGSPGYGAENPTVMRPLEASAGSMTAPRRYRRTGWMSAAAAAAVLAVVLSGLVVVRQVWGVVPKPGSPVAGGTSPGAGGGVPSAAGVASGSPSGSPATAKGTLVVSTDLPLQGTSGSASAAANQAVKLYLEQIGHTAGGYRIELRTYDDSTAASGRWDAAQCALNAEAHLADPREVAVLGTYNTGCSKVMLPVLGRPGADSLLMVSHGNTNPGLTKPWDPGEPAVHYPSGVRNFARVVPTDDLQGVAGARYAKTLAVSSVYVVNDGEVYGRGVAGAFEAEARRLGIAVVGSGSWDPAAADYSALFAKIKASGAGAVYLGGLADSNGSQLITDKVATLGANSGVKLVAPDGFTGYPEIDGLAQAQGMYLTYGGLSLGELKRRGGAAAAFQDSYLAAYGQEPASVYAIYAVAALQVILAGIERSDGTRRGVREAVLGGSGVTVPASASVLGRSFSIDPATGDIDLGDHTVSVIQNSREAVVTSVST